MTQVVKITRDGVEAEVVDRYVGAFLADGWTRVDERTEELGAKSTWESEEEARQKSMRDAELELKAAADEKEAQEAGLAKAEREKQADEQRHAQEALNHSRIGVDHAKAISELKDKDDVEAYVKTNFHKDLDKRGSLDVVKEKALIISKEAH